MLENYGGNNMLQHGDDWELTESVVIYKLQINCKLLFLQQIVWTPLKYTKSKFQFLKKMLLCQICCVASHQLYWAVLYVLCIAW